MPTIPVDDAIGFGTQVRAYLDKYKTQLIAKGFDPANTIAEIQTAEGDLATANQDQESLKTQRSDQTVIVEAKLQGLYDLASSTLDAVVGFLGKTTNTGREGLRIRSKLRGRQIDDVIGFAQQVRAYIIKYQTKLTAAGYDSTAVVAQLDTDAESLATENQTQETLVSDLKDQTKLVEKKIKDLYKKISGTVDVAAGLLGKKTAQGKEGLNIRKNLLGTSPSPSPPSPPPPSPPPPSPPPPSPPPPSPPPP